MKQRIHAALDPRRDTYWGRVKPGSKKTLWRAIRRIAQLSEDERLVDNVFLRNNHWIYCNLQEPPKRFQQWRKENDLDWLDTSSNNFEIDQDPILYETAWITSTQVDTVSLPDGLIFLGHTPEYRSAADKERGEMFMRAYERATPYRLARRAEISRLRRLHPDMPSGQLLALARKNVEHLMPTYVEDETDGDK